MSSKALIDATASNDGMDHVFDDGDYAFLYDHRKIFRKNTKNKRHAMSFDYMTDSGLQEYKQECSSFKRRARKFHIRLMKGFADVKKREICTMFNENCLRGGMKPSKKELTTVPDKLDENPKDKLAPVTDVDTVVATKKTKKRASRRLVYTKKVAFDKSDSSPQTKCILTSADAVPTLFGGRAAYKKTKKTKRFDFGSHDCNVNVKYLLTDAVDIDNFEMGEDFIQDDMTRNSRKAKSKKANSLTWQRQCSSYEKEQHCLSDNSENSPEMQRTWNNSFVYNYLRKHVNINHRKEEDSLMWCQNPINHKKEQDSPKWFQNTTTSWKKPNKSKRVGYDYSVFNDDYHFATTPLNYHPIEDDHPVPSPKDKWYGPSPNPDLTLEEYLIQKFCPIKVINPKAIEVIEIPSESPALDTITMSDFEESVEKPENENNLCKDGFFEDVMIDMKQIGNAKNFAAKFNELNEIETIKFSWLNSSKTHCMIDLTLQLDEFATNIALVVVVEEMKTLKGKLRVTLNGSFPCPTGLVEYIRNETFASATTFATSLVEKSQKMYTDHFNALNRRSELMALNAMYQASRLVFDIEPFGDYKILNLISNEVTEIKAIVVDMLQEEDAYEDEKKKDEEFVVIGLEDCFDADKTDTESIATDDLEIIPDFDIGCDLCTELDPDELFVLNGCGHNFCRQCLRSELTSTIVRKSAYPLTCLHRSCKKLVYMEFLPALVPLPVAQYYYRFAFMAESVAKGMSVVECPRCNNLASYDYKLRYGTVKCCNCSIAFCAKCLHQPHFPLTCLQAIEWEERFEKQYAIDLARENPMLFRKCECGELFQNKAYSQNVHCTGCGICYDWTTGVALTPGITGVLSMVTHDFQQSNIIAAEFSEPASYAHMNRFNPLSCRKKANHKIKESTFNANDFDAANLILHLIEYGFAWLYIMRKDRPANWSSIKNQLNCYRRKYEAATQLPNNEFFGKTMMIAFNAVDIFKKFDDSE